MNYPIFDAHCDTLSRAADTGAGLRKNTYQADIERMLACGGGYAQVFAAFVDKKEIWASPMIYALHLIEYYHEQTEGNSDCISHCVNTKEIKAALAEGKTAAILSVEGGEAIEGSLDNLRILYRLGVRLMTLTWNYANEICDGIGEVRGGGLTEFGRTAVAEMNRLGMVIDVSHISQKGFWDVLETSSMPVAATHSDCLAIHTHRRNLSDEQICALIKSNGFIGINFYPDFVADGECGIDDVVRHIEHILALGGEDNIGLGSDFDGIDRTPRDLRGVQDMHILTEQMLKMGYSDELVRKITFENFMRLFETVTG